ncbi:MAG: ABC transporter ATP-binding protein [Candidatus Rokubacteria bacterium]|nr:ABC transporter ATP-binding protein [Candidatus Rokubacteria bacterium]
MLEVEDIHTYYGLSHVLHGVRLTVGEGEVVALLGRNGAGKTTTLRSIIGLTPPARGRITFKAERISGLPPYAVARKGLAYVPETREVFSLLSVEENLMLAQKRDSRWDRERILGWFPNLRPLLGRKGSQISGGEQQMTVIGRGLLTGPELLLLDEPSQGLAPLMAATVLGMLRDLKRERLSVLIVEQSVKIAMELADRIYILANGCIVFEGTPTDLQQRPEVVERHMGVSA